MLHIKSATIIVVSETSFTIEVSSASFSKLEFFTASTFFILGFLVVFFDEMMILDSICAQKQLLRACENLCETPETPLRAHTTLFSILH